MQGRAAAKVAACAVVIAASAYALVRLLRPSAAPIPSLAPIPAVSLRLEDGLSCDVYVPEGLDRSRKHPLVFGSSPGGNARELLPVWKDACDRFEWILAASNNFRNGKRSEKDAALQMETLAILLRDYPVDPSRVYATGLSGAGMHAHDLVADFPDKFRGVVVNTGMMPHHWKGNDPFDATHYPRTKVAVMLASPTDFRFHEMQEDRKLLEGVGWQVLWIEFPGGHTYAPPASYVQAAAWLTAQAPPGP
jgi:poly(3-hydroxybutyrate) depolymerase